MLRSISISNLNSLNKTPFNPCVNSSFSFDFVEDKTKYLFWEKEKLPTNGGVYIIYDYFGIAIYVGESNNIQERFIQHYRDKKSNGDLKKEYEDFRPFAYYVKLYIVKNINDRKLLERILIKSLEPAFNRDDQSTKCFEYILDCGYMDNIDMWIVQGIDQGKGKKYKILLDMLDNLEGDRRLHLFRNIKEHYRVLLDLSPSEKEPFALIDVWHDVWSEVFGSTLEIEEYDYPPNP